MNIFAKFGELVIKMFNFIGTLILAIPKLPSIIRSINTNDIKDRVNSESLKENLSKVKDTGLEISEVGISKVSEIKNSQNLKENTEKIQMDTQLSGEFTSKQKERTIFQLQLISVGFLVICVLYLFNFLSFIIYCILGIVLVIYMAYLLFSKVKLMYPVDFNAYRDFFSMYIVAGIVLVLVSSNPNFVMAFSFEFFPYLTILIFAALLSVAVFLIFRIRYHRDFTYGTVVEVGDNTSYVKVEYDICSNVKPDMYFVTNKCGANKGDEVKLQIKEKLLSTGGNKPVSIIEILK
ncbi:DUF2101 family protein [Methanobacterium sp.]|uniref:DUF2101 family protein n=1 Tax=Methanobacterium sp. TaxID=2164 RepID=UPI003C79307D